MKLPAYFSTFPVNNKIPLVDWKPYMERLPNKQEIDSWKTLPSSHLGIATGPISKVLVLDDDGGLSASGHSVPKTWVANTPRGGKHYYFKWTEELNNKVTTKVGILPGVDVRGAGGYVCFYGFEMPFFSTPLALPPKWLIDLLPDKDSRITNNSSQIANTDKSKLQELLDGIIPGNRNDSFTRVAGSFRARGYSSSDIFGILSPKAREVGFGLNELKTICDSVSRYSPSESFVEYNSQDDQASSIEEFLKDQQKVEWICEGLIAKRSIGFVAGLPETNKTWMMMDLAIECAKGGGLWLNKFPVGKAKVLFIDQERFKGETQRRLKSLINGSKAGLSCKNALFVKCGTSVRLNLQISFDTFKKEIAELRPDLVIIDSFVSFHTSEENNRKDIQVVLERVKELRNEFGCTFLFIHHESKMAFNQGEDAVDPSIAQMAGSVAIPAAAELVLTVRKQDSESSMVYNTKNTLAPSVSPFLVKVTDMDETKTKIKVEAF